MAAELLIGSGLGERCAAMSLELNRMIEIVLSRRGPKGVYWGAFEWAICDMVQQWHETSTALASVSSYAG